MNANRDDDLTIRELVARKRAAGYDAEFEALLARKWVCPHCRHEATILTITIVLGDGSEPFCPACDREGIEPLDDAGPQLSVITGGKAVPA